MAPWITVFSRHTVLTKRVIYYKFTFVWYSVKEGTMHRPMSHLAHLCTVPFFGCEKNTDSRAVGLISLPSVCYGYFCWGLLLLFLFVFFFLNITSFHTWFQVGVSNQNFTDGFLLKFYLFFSSHCSRPTIICLVYTTVYDLAQFQKRNTSELWMSFTVTAKQI